MTFWHQFLPKAAPHAAPALPAADDTAGAWGSTLNDMIDYRDPTKVADPAAAAAHIAPDAADDAAMMQGALADPLALAARRARTTALNIGRENPAVVAKAREAANMLLANRKNVGYRDARWKFLDTLDRIEDSVTRELMEEFFQEANGRSLHDFIEHAGWQNTGTNRDKDQALDLISPERDNAEESLARMSPDERAKMEANAARWASEILDVTRSGPDADEGTNPHRITRVLGPRSPMEIEAIRKQIREQGRDSTYGDTSLYQELERSLTGENEAKALTALGGDPVASAKKELLNTTLYPERSKELLRDLIRDTQGSAKLSDSERQTLLQSLPQSDRAEVEALLDSNVARADGLHFADLLAPDWEGARVSVMGFDEASTRKKEARSAANTLAEMRDMDPDSLRLACLGWQRENPGRTFEDMIKEKYGARSLETQRMLLLLDGERGMERALAARDGVKRFDQAQVEAALANPALADRDDPNHEAAVREQAEMKTEMERLDQLENDMTGTGWGARTASEQLDDFDHAIGERKPTTSNFVSVLNAQGVRPTNNAATHELLDTGTTSVVTKLRRAKNAGDADAEHKLLRGLSGTEYAKTKTEYEARYHEPIDTHQRESDAVIQKIASSYDVDKDDVAHAMRTTAEQTLVRDYEMPPGTRNVFYTLGVDAERTAMDHSDAVEKAQAWGYTMGGNRGSDVRLSSSYENESRRVMAGDEVGARIANENVDDAVGAQGIERKQLADDTASSIDTITTIVGLLTASPWLGAAIETCGGAASIYEKADILGPEYTAVGTDVAHLAVDAAAAATSVGGKAAGSKAIPMIAKAGKTVANDVIDEKSGGSTVYDVANKLCGGPLAGFVSGGTLGGEFLIRAVLAKGDLIKAGVQTAEKPLEKVFEGGANKK